MMERIVTFAVMFSISIFMQYVLERTHKSISLSSIWKVYLYTAIGLISSILFCNRLSCAIVPLILVLLGGHVIIEVINLPTKRVVCKSINTIKILRKRVIKSHFIYNIICQLIIGIFIIL